MARVHERETFALDEGGRDGLAVELDEARLVVEKIDLAGATGHEEKDDVLGLGGEHGRARRHGIRRGSGGGEPALAEHRSEGDATEAHRAATEKMTAREVVRRKRVRGVEGREGRHGKERGQGSLCGLVIFRERDRLRSQGDQRRRAVVFPSGVIRG